MYDYVCESLLNYESNTSIFLDKLKKIEISIPSIKHSSSVELKHKKDFTFTVCTESNSKETNIDYWIATKELNKPKYIGEESRKNITSTSIKIALAPLNQTVLRHNVFSFLPTEMHSGFPFLINADFILTANRETLLKKEWNNWLLDEVGVFCAESIDTIIKDKNFRAKALEFIPFSTNVKKAGDHFRAVYNKAHETLKNLPVIKCHDNKWRKPEQVIQVPSNFRELFKACKAVKNIYWVHKSITSFEDVLNELKIKSLNSDELEEYLNCSKWIVKQNDSWLINLYHFLYSVQGGYKYLKKLPLFPSSNGELKCLSSGSLFSLPTNNKKEKLPKNKLFPEVALLKESLLRLIENDHTMHRILFSNGLIPEFSVNTYYKKILIPHLKSLNLTYIHATQKYSLIKWVVENWKNINKNQHDLPILLHTGELTIVSLPCSNVIVPKNYNKPCWSELFSEESKSSEISFIHPFYLELGKDCRSFFNDTGINNKVKPIVIKQDDFCQLGGNYQDYDKLINSVFFHNGKYPNHYNKTGEFPLLPKVFWSLNQANISVRQQFIKWIENHINQNNFTDSVLYWQSYHSNKSESYTSPALYYLKEHPWLKTTKGYKRPTDCFIDDKNIRRILSDSVPYIAEKIPSLLVDKLGIKKEVSDKNIIELLKQLSRESSCDTNQIQTLYHALNDDNGDLQDIFNKNNLIYIPSKKRWVTSADVVWENTSDLPGNFLIGLEKDHPKLKEFFLNTVRINRNPTPENYSKIWILIQDQENSLEKNDKLLNRVSKSLMPAIKKNKNSSWLNDFKRKARVLTTDNQWISLDSANPPLIVDDKRLAEIFTGLVPFAHIIKGESYKSMKPLTDFLRIKNLSEITQFTVENNKNKSPLKENKVFTTYSCILLCHALANIGKDCNKKFNNLLKEGRIEILFNFREIEVNNLDLIVSISETSHEAILENQDSFIDWKNRVLYTGLNSDCQDIYASCAAQLAKILFDDNHQFYEDSFSHLLGVTSSNEFDKKLSRKPNWTFSDQQYAQISNYHQLDKFNQLSDEEISELEIVEQLAEKDNTPNTLLSDDQNTVEIKKISTSNTEELIVDEEILHLNNNESKSKSTKVSHQNLRKDLASSHNNNTSKTHEAITVNKNMDSRKPKEYHKSNQNSTISRPSQHNQNSKKSTAPQPGSGYKSNSLSSSSKMTQDISQRNSRSMGQAKAYNLRQSRLVSYVTPNTNSDSIDTTEAERVGDLGEIAVMENLHTKGYAPVRMPKNNEGYDIEFTYSDIYNKQYVEVKTLSGSWYDSVVTMTQSQYDSARIHATNYFLAIVENIESGSPKIHFIKNPAQNIIKYAFDIGWKGVATDIPSISSSEITKSVHEELCKLTDNAQCQEIIHYCHKNRYPLPEIGVEISDDAGRVMIESIELAWEQECFGVLLDEQELHDISSKADEWQFMLCASLNQVYARLDELFQSEGSSK